MKRKLPYTPQPCYQQGHILVALAPLKKPRLEYLVLKLGITPHIAGGGTGTVNYYSLKNVLECKIGDVLTKWGFSFDQVKKSLGELSEKFPDFFDKGTWLADVCKSIENMRKHLLLYCRVYSHGLDGKTVHQITFIPYVTIGTYEGITQVNLHESNDKLAAFLNEQGFMFLDLSELKTLIVGRLDSTQNYQQILPPKKS